MVVLLATRSKTGRRGEKKREIGKEMRETTIGNRRVSDELSVCELVGRKFTGRDNFRLRGFRAISRQLSFCLKRSVAANVLAA